MIRNQMYSMQKEVNDHKFQKTLEEMRKAGMHSRLQARLEKIKIVSLQNAKSLCKSLGKALNKMVTIYVLWIVFYTVLEHFAPGLPSQILANLGKAWQAIVEIVFSNSMMKAIFHYAVWLLEKCWEVFSMNLPFLV